MTDHRDPAADDAVRELLALAAVGALDAEEQAGLDAVLAERPDLAAELAELREAVVVAAEVVRESPPPSLRASVLAAIAAEPQLPAAAPLAAVVPLRPRRSRWAIAVTAAAAVAVLVVGGLVVTQLVGDESTTDRIAQVADAPGAVTIELGGELDGLQLVHAPDLGDTVLVGDGIPAPDGDQVYELWLIAGGDPPLRVETFRPHDDGTVGVLMDDMAPPPGATFAITIEPAGGVDAPTGSVVAQSA